MTDPFVAVADADWDLPDPRGGPTPRPDSAPSPAPKPDWPAIDRMLGLRHGLVGWRPFGRDFGPTPPAPPTTPPTITQPRRQE
jgi:hypothetical protein